MKNALKRQSVRLFKSNSDIQSFYRDKINFKDSKDKRSKVNVAVIDDEPFAPQANLSSYGYKIDPIGDIKDIHELEEYGIVLCDIIGVGRYFDKSTQGASIISEIKLNYPEKIVLAYTGAMLNQSSARLAGQRADKIIKKDADIEEWITVLDGYCDDVMDPYQVWKKIRKRLVEMDASTKNILILEDAYVASVESRDASFSLLKEALNENGIGQDVRGIFQGVVGSALFSLLFGA